jgi:hypothetical protein
MMSCSQPWNGWPGIIRNAFTRRAGMFLRKNSRKATTRSRKAWQVYLIRQTRASKEAGAPHNIQRQAKHAHKALADENNSHEISRWIQAKLPACDTRQHHGEPLRPTGPRRRVAQGGKFSEQIWENQASVNNAGPLPAHAITELQRPDRSTTEGSLPDRPRAAARGRPAWPGAPWPGIPSVPGLSDDLTRSCRGERGICRPEHEEPLLPQRVQLAPYILAEAALHRACERPDG